MKVFAQNFCFSDFYSTFLVVLSKHALVKKIHYSQFKNNFMDKKLN